MFDFEPGLRPPVSEAPPRMRRLLREVVGDDGAHCETASVARISLYHECRSKDVVIARADGGRTMVAEVWFHATVAGRLVSLVSQWPQLTSHSALGSMRCRESIDNVMLITSTDI